MLTALGKEHEHSSFIARKWDPRPTVPIETSYVGLQWDQYDIKVDRIFIFPLPKMIKFSS